VCIVCIQRQLEEEINELTSKLAIKEKEIIKLKDNEKQLCKRISENKVSIKQLETAANKVWCYIHMYLCICMFIPLQPCVRGKPCVKGMYICNTIASTQYYNTIICVDNVNLGIVGIDYH